MYMSRFVWFLSDDEVNQFLAPGMGAACELNVVVRFPEEGLPEDDCRGLVMDVDSMAPALSAQQWLVKELSGRPYPIVVFGWGLHDEQLMDFRAAGIKAFQHGMCPAVFAAIAKRSANAASDVLVG
jgi:hypothetical protein